MDILGRACDIYLVLLGSSSFPALIRMVTDDIGIFQSTGAISCCTGRK